jgi:DNA end-binding protein Ku
LPIKSLRAIEIERFVHIEQIDPILFTRTYYLEPEELGMKPFALLWRVMSDTNKAAIGTFTLRMKEHVCILRPYGDALALSPLLYADEVKSTESLRAPSEVDVPVEMLEVAKAYVEALFTPFEHEKYEDAYRSAVEAICVEKAGDLPHPKASSPQSTLPDLMSALRQAVEDVHKKRQRDATK